MDDPVPDTSANAGNSPSRSSAAQPIRPPSDPERWVDQHGNALFRYALTRVHDRPLAEDLVQETFLAALKVPGSFRGESSERTWLTSILRNKLIDHLRKYGNQARVPDIEPADDAVDRLFDGRGSWKVPPSGWTVDPPSLLEQSEFWGVFEGCLDALQERAARVFSLRVLDGVASEEVCRILGVTPNNLGVLLHRARERLRRCLEANWFSDGPKGGR